MLRIDLFRLRLFQPKKLPLFDAPFDRPLILKAALAERPTSPSWRGTRWHIGNVADIATDAAYFRVGRQSLKTLPVIDTATGNFEDSELASAPYTHAILDLKLGLLGVAHNYSVSPSTKAVARRIAQVLQHSEIVRSRDAEVAVGAIRDPTQFIRALEEAFAVTSFTFTVRKQNPIDANRLFVKPYERLVEAAGGSCGKSIIKGADLDREALTGIATTVAATGETASARMIPARGNTKVTRKLEGDTVSTSVESLDDGESQQVALDALRGAYKAAIGESNDESTP